MKEDLKKKLKKYLAVSGAVASGAAAQAQEVYHNIPDTTINTHGGYYDLDLNQDGTANFRIRLLRDSGPDSNLNAITITPLGQLTNRVAGQRANGYGYPARLSPGMAIHPNTPFQGLGQNDTTGFMAFEVGGGGGYPNSNWVGPVTDGYLGLSIRVSDSVYFGWARLDVDSGSGSFTVKDFAHTTRHNDTIRAGSTFIKVSENTLTHVDIRVSENTLNVRFEKHRTGTAEVYDLSGRKHISARLENGFFEKDLSYLSSGMYIVRIEMDGKARAEKFIIR